MKLKFTGPTFYLPETDSFQAELYVENGLVTKPQPVDQVIELPDGFALPAFRDGHAHPLFAGREASGPNVTGLKSIAEIQEKLREYRKQHPDLNWIEGGAYDRSLVDGGVFLASWLDEAVSDVPLVLHASDHHTLWVNSKVLALLPTPLPRLTAGSIDTDVNGNATGVLREPEAMNLVLSKAPKRSLSEDVAALEWADKHLASLGIVEVQDAWIIEEMTETYLSAIEDKRLLLDYNLGFKIEPAEWLFSLETAKVKRNSVANLNSSQLRAETVKFFADGVFGSGTAAVLSPYLDNPDSLGEPLWEQQQLNQAALACAKEGFQLHIHAIGDAGVRQALEAIEFVQSRTGMPKLPAVIAHAELIADQDLKRFGQLGVIANMQPLWAREDGMLLSCVDRLGRERIESMYRMRDLKAHSATISFGSDWPVSSPNPLIGIYTAVTRQTEAGLPAGGWTRNQALSRKEALNSYTSEVSKQMHGFDQPALALGQPADFVVIDRDILSVEVSELFLAKILATYRQGIRLH